MHPALFQKGKVSPTLFPSSVGRESWIPTENLKMLFEKYASERIPALKKQQILSQNAILFLHGETFNKRGE